MPAGVFPTVRIQACDDILWICVGLQRECLLFCERQFLIAHIKQFGLSFLYDSNLYGYYDCNLIATSMDLLFKEISCWTWWKNWHSMDTTILCKMIGWKLFPLLKFQCHSDWHYFQKMTRTAWSTVLTA